MSHNECAKLISSQGAELGNPMKVEAQTLVFEVGSTAAPGATVKAKKLFVCRELGYPAGSWRIHDAWHGRASGWSYAAMRDLQVKVQGWREKRAKLAAEQAATKALLAQQQDIAALKAARADHLRALQQLNSRLAAMGFGEEP